MSVSAKDVKALRDRTGAGMMECKAALVEAGGDAEKAVDILRVKGAAKAEKRGGREAAEGTVASYIHANKQVGVLVEVDCETDFVARGDEFQAFAYDVALHVAGSPTTLAVTEEEVPAEAREREARIFAEQAAGEGKPENVQQKISEGRMRKWLEEVVLLNQKHVNEAKHESKTIEQLRADLSAKTGENIVIRRFSRFAVGE
ncbi:MAG: tsf [Solirubrobacterales bacterium]|nr:tsf [Solirubrobacterales bacterium]